MKDCGKILFLDPLDAVAPSVAPACPPEAEISPDAALFALVSILEERELDPVARLSGYLIAEDPTYLPEGTNARMLARRVGRDKLMEALIEHYLKTRPADGGCD